MTAIGLSDQVINKPIDIDNLIELFERMGGKTTK